MKATVNHDDDAINNIVLEESMYKTLIQYIVSDILDSIYLWMGSFATPGILCVTSLAYSMYTSYND